MEATGRSLRCLTRSCPMLPPGAVPQASSAVDRPSGAIREILPQEAANVTLQLAFATELACQCRHYGAGPDPHAGAGAFTGRGAGERTVSQPFAAGGATGQGPDLPHDAGREGFADAGSCRGHFSAAGAGLCVVERGRARGDGRRLCHGVPAGDRAGCHLGHATDQPDRGGDLDGGAGQVSPGHPRGQPRLVLRPHVLGAEHQHLPRSSLGSGAGDVRGGSVPDRADGDRVRHRHAG